MHFLYAPPENTWHDCPATHVDVKARLIVIQVTMPFELTFKYQSINTASFDKLSELKDGFSSGGGRVLQILSKHKRRAEQRRSEKQH